MQKTKLLIGTLLILTLASSIALIAQTGLAFAADPAKLKIYIGPTNVPADNKVYESIFVELEDSNSRPARALQDTVISLSSSLTSVGTVEQAITITAGTTFAVAKFYSTFTPGTTAIAASSSGYPTVQANLVTIAPVPSKLALYGFPPTLPADGIQYNALVVQLQDSSGNPAKAPLEGVTVDLFSTNGTVASVSTFVTITGGQTYALASMTSNSSGIADITAMSSGYTSAQTRITAQTPSTTPATSLKIYVAPPKTMADNTEHPLIVVQLLNAAGKIAQPTAPVSIQLSSSNENVGKVQSTIEIPLGRTHTSAAFYATYLAGATTVTAATTGLQADTEPITTVGPVPSKLAVYCNPSGLPADSKEYTAIQVQLQDSSGKPALDPNGDVTVSLFSSEPTVGTVQATLTIPYGSTYATTTFKSAYLTSSTSITAQASGYTTGQATMKTYMIDQASLDVIITADPVEIVSGTQTSLTAYVVDPGGNPATGATVKLESSNGGTFTTVKMTEDGYYTSTFTAPSFKIQTSVTITATVSKADYTTGTTTMQVIVTPKVLPGTLQICIKDDADIPVTEATVKILSQPSGVAGLTATTNSTGYVAFPNSIEGNYSVSVVKEGFEPMNTTFIYKAGSSPKTLYITEASQGRSYSSMMVWIIPAAVIGGIVIFVIVLTQRRKVGLGPSTS